MGGRGSLVIIEGKVGNLSLAMKSSGGNTSIKGPDRRKEAVRRNE